MNSKNNESLECFILKAILCVVAVFISLTAFIFLLVNTFIYMEIIFLWLGCLAVVLLGVFKNKFVDSDNNIKKRLEK